MTYTREDCTVGETLSMHQVHGKMRHDTFKEFTYIRLENSNLRISIVPKSSAFTLHDPGFVLSGQRSDVYWDAILLN